MNDRKRLRCDSRRISRKKSKFPLAALGRRALKAINAIREIPFTRSVDRGSRGAPTAVLVGLLVLLVIGPTACGGSSPGPPEKVTIGISATSLLASLIHIADEKGMFLAEGVDVEIKGYATGKAALEALFEGDVDMATVADTPIVTNSFKRDDFSVVATIVDSALDHKVLARRDRNIATPGDLVGKRVATTIGTSAHFFLTTLLVRNGLDISDIEITNLKPGEMVGAITSGDVDAIATWEPNILKSQQLLGENGVVLLGLTRYEATFSLVTFNEFIENNSDLLVKVVTGLVKAEEFSSTNREESIDIMASRLEVDRADIVSLWQDYRFRVSMSQTFLLTLDDVARWLILNNLTDKAEVPNFLDYVYVDALDEVKTEAVTIIR